MHFTIKQKRVRGRHHIQVSATPKTPESRALLTEFKAGLSKLEKKWKAIVRARERAKAKAKSKSRSRRKAKK